MTRLATIPGVCPASTSGSAAPRARSRVRRLAVLARSWQGQNARGARSASGAHKVKVPLPSEGPLAPPPDVVDAVDAWPWRGGLEPCGDHDLASVEVEGTIPRDLSGSFYRVGPGRIRVGKDRYAHWFDGDGMIFGAELDGSSNTARAACKMVRTPRLAKQERAGDDAGVAVRGAWTQARSNLANLFNFPTNPANTSPLFHAGKLLVLCEGGAPIEVDPLSLETVGERIFGPNLPMGFSAHAKKDSRDGRLYTWGLCKPPAVGFQVAKLAADGRVEKVVQLPLDTPEFTLIHDCAMSDRFLAFVVPPWKLGFDKVAGALSGASSFGHSFDWRDDLGTYLVIIEKATMAVVHQGTIPAMSTYHFAGAYEEVAEVPKPPGGSWDEHDDPFEFCGYTGFGDAECADDDVLDRKEDGKEDEEKEPRTRELLHILVNRLNGDRRALEANFSSMYDSVWDPTGYNTLCDYVVDLGTGALLSSEALVPTGDAAWGGKGDVDDGQLPMEFPVTAPGARLRKPRFVYTLGFTGGGAGYFDSVQKLDAGACKWRDGVRVCQRSGAHKTRVMPPGVFPSEVEFVPKKAGEVSEEEEDDGYLLYLEYDSRVHRSSLVILDAADIEGKELARVKMPYHVPHTFHGTFTRAGEGAR